MVAVGPDLQERDLVAGRGLQADVAQGRVHGGVEDGAAVLGPTDQVLHQDRDVVALANEGAHATR